MTAHAECPEFKGILNAPPEVIEQAFQTSIYVSPEAIEQAWRDILELKKEQRNEILQK